MEKIFCQNTDKKFSVRTKNWNRRTSDHFLQKLQTTGSRTKSV